MKKTLTIIAVIIIIGAVAVAFFAFRKNPSTAGGSGTTGGGTTGTLPSSTTSTPFNPPTGNTITIGTPEGSVTMNNFYNTTQRVSADHTAVLIDATATYNITYYAPDSSFNILITETPVATIQAQAESAFLQDLGISQADACKLNVKVGAPISVDPNYAGQNLPLSFCSGSAFQGQPGQQ